MVFRDGKILIGKRKSILGQGEWGFPGGHLEAGEALTACAMRETREETGMEIANVQFCVLGNIPNTFTTHFVQIGFTADWRSGEPQVLEPTKCEGWQWRSLDDLPTPLFLPTKMMTDAYLTKNNFLDSK